MNDTQAQAVLEFWFAELTPKQWFSRDAALDALIRQRFATLHRSVAQCEYPHWRQTAHGRLAEIVVLDQFSRNLYRDQAQAFACDAQALVLAQEAVSAGMDQALSPVERSFLYMPWMHSESRRVHERALQLYDQPGLEENLRFEIRHKEIIDRFGRYFYRNALLGR